ncbi:MAG: SH3 domain-containing protein [Planctomycetes bacterium]|nr:SH3 domain-containing protein [Planctomycetota bacterium]
MQARHDTIQDVHQKEKSTFFKTRIFVILLVSALFSTAFAQTLSTTMQPGFPYKAEVTGSSVNIRSDKSIKTYECGRLNVGDTVEVIGEEEGWAKIVPPPGSFSWIAMQYIAINAEDPTTGIVTGKNIQVYAGSDYREPRSSSIVQATVNRGDRVQLKAEEKDGYFKIHPPKGSFLWVSTLYLKQIAQPVIQRPIIPIPDPTELPADINKPLVPTIKIDPNASKDALSEAALLKQYYEIQAQIKAQLGKPIDEQNYTEIKKALLEMASRKDTVNTARYADFTLKKIQGYELAISVSAQLSASDLQMAQTKEKIEKALAAQIAQIENLGRFAVIGTLKPSIVFDGSPDTKRFRIQDAKGKTICYVKPVGLAKTKDMTAYFDKKVGLVGKITVSSTGGSAMVEFSEISLIP